MTFEYITAALEHARYEIIEDAEPYYGEVPELPGVWATGRTLEECRRNPAGVIDERPINGSGAGSRSPGCRPHRGRGHRGGHRCRSIGSDLSCGTPGFVPMGRSTPTRLWMYESDPVVNTGTTRI